MKIENRKLILEYGDKGHFKFKGVDNISKYETLLEFDCDIPDAFTYSVKDIRQSAYSVPFTSTNVTLTYTGVITDNRGAEPISTEETFTVEIPFEPNDSDIVNNVISDALDFHGVEVPYQITSLCKKNTPLTFYNPNETTANVGIFKAATSGGSVTVEYSFDGENWTPLKATSTTVQNVSIPSHSYIMFRNTTTSGKFTDDRAGYNGFVFDEELIPCGNIASLIYNDFDTRSIITLTSNYQFSGLFKDQTHLTDASNVLLDYVKLTQNSTVGNSFASMFECCSGLVSAPRLPLEYMGNNTYAAMFKDCSSLEIAPELPALHLVNGCYFNMFNGCTNLKYVKADFIDEPSTTYTNNWLQDVASEGIFVKNPESTWNVIGNSGIPVGWTMKNSDDSALYTFGVLSDWHYGSADGDRTTNQATFVKPDVISNFYKAQNVDFMTLDGDLTYNGKVEELTKFKNMVATQFGDMPFYYNQGNHDAVCTDANYESTMGVKKNFVEIKNEDVFIFASQDYTSTRISDDKNDVAYKNSVNWILETLEKYKGFRIFLYIHYCFYGMAGAAPGVSYGFKNGSAIAKSIVDKVKEVGNTLVFTGHTHFDMLRDTLGDGYVHTQELGNNCWMVHIPSCGWCKTGNGKDEINCIKDPYPEDTTYGKIYRSQGYVAEAYPDKVILKAYQFNTNEWLGDYVFNITGITEKVGSSLVDQESKDPVVPEGQDYVELESVYVNSASWFTDYNLQDGDIMEWKGTLTKTSQYIIGSSDSSSLNRFDIQYTSNKQVQMGFSNSSVKAGTQVIMDGEPHILKANSVDKSVYCDGVKIASTTSAWKTPTRPMKVCGVGGPTYDTDSTHMYIGRFYEASVYDSDGVTMKHHWVPVYYKDGKYKLLDTVTDTFLEPTDDGEIHWKE